jgi:excinuclease ABC subunit A
MNVTAEKELSHDKEIDIQKNIYIKNAHSNNLKNIDVIIPKKKMVVVTGLSGSGKSSLIMDTLYAEGQRRYVESLSSYARQFLDRMKKPEVEYIKGICPAIAIEQRVTSGSARSTVGSLTEIYDYLRLLYARIGKTYSPISGEKVIKHEVNEVVDFIFSHSEGIKIQLFIHLQSKYERLLTQDLSLLLQKGYTRIRYKNELSDIQELLEGKFKKSQKKSADFQGEMVILVDRFVVNDVEENKNRIADSVLTAFSEGDGECIVEVIGGASKSFNNRFEADGIQFLEPTHQLFNYNNPYGACPKCEGYGRVLGIDPEKVIPSENLSIYDGAIVCWNGEKGKYYYSQLVNNAHKFEFPIHSAYKNLTQDEKDLLWDGNQYFSGISNYFEELKEKSYKIQNRVLLARYRGKTKCPTCKGGRLRKEATYVKIQNTHISQLINIPVEELLEFFDNLILTEHDFQIAKRILIEVKSRLEILLKIGLSYLTLDRLASSLSGGETQRINLTRTLGSNLTNSLYILDEPSIGLHPKDSEKLVKVLLNLRDLGNTVVVVEHEEDVIRNADHIIDMGPKAGIYGGEIVFNGPFNEFVNGKIYSLTADYLTGKRAIPIPEYRRTFANKLYIEGANQHNLKDVDVLIPLNVFTVVTGVSGSGKTSLVKHILYPALKRELGEALSSAPGKFGRLSGDISSISTVELVSQNPIGKSSRSNPVTYVKAYDSIRKLFADQQLSKIRGYAPKHFSFNVEGGRCENCKGDGYNVVEMQFLADVTLVCEECEGKRFKDEVLEVQYNDKNIADVLNLSIDEAMDFFVKKKDIINKIKPLQDVGLGYVKLGQPSNTLSGGEAQRVKLASFLGKESRIEPVFFIFDEPTTGLHFHDILKLMDAFNALVENGHTVLVVEHNLDVIKEADWIIDLGPGGGSHGGELVFQGTPEDLIKLEKSFTGQFLKSKLE